MASRRLRYKKRHTKRRKYRGGGRASTMRASTKSRTKQSISKTPRVSHRHKDVNDYGSRITDKLIQHCNRGEWDEYEDVVLQILNDNRNGKNDFFEYMNKHIKKMDPHTIFCLEYAFTRLQEEVVDTSMDYISHVWEMTRKYPEEREQVREHRRQAVKNKSK